LVVIFSKQNCQLVSINFGGGENTCVREMKEGDKRERWMRGKEKKDFVTKLK
jgi:hypothetical protein